MFQEIKYKPLINNCEMYSSLNLEHNIIQSLIIIVNKVLALQ